MTEEEREQWFQKKLAELDRKRPVTPWPPYKVILAMPGAQLTKARLS